MCTGQYDYYVRFQLPPASDALTSEAGGKASEAGARHQKPVATVNGRRIYTYRHTYTHAHTLSLSLSLSHTHTHTHTHTHIGCYVNDILNRK